MALFWVASEMHRQEAWFPPLRETPQPNPMFPVLCAARRAIRDLVREFGGSSSAFVLLYRQRARGRLGCLTLAPHALATLRDETRGALGNVDRKVHGLQWSVQYRV